MASKSYGWDVRNIAKISSKMAKKVIFRFFRFSQKLSIRFERNFLQSFYTLLWSFMCNFIKFVWLGCEKQPNLAQKWPKKQSFFDFLTNCSYDSNESESEGKRLKPTSLPHIRLCFFLVFFSRPFHENFKFLKNCPYDFSKILHSHSTPKGAPACAKALKSYDWVVRNIAKISPKMAEKQPFFDFFRFSQKLSIRFERNFLQLFYTILESYMCNDIKIVWLGCEKHSQN